jgi:hypothetical protein
MGKYLEDRELDSVLENYFNENSSIEILNEGILSRLFKNKSGKYKKGDICYICKGEIKQGEVVRVYNIYKDQSTAVLSYILSESGVVYNDNKVYTNKSWYSFDVEVSFAKCEIAKINKKSSISYDLKVIEIIDNNINYSKLLNKYSIEVVEGKVPANIKSGRMSVYNKVLQIAKQALSEIDVKKGFKIANDNEENGITEFSIGITNHVDIINCDAWAFTGNKARDEEEYNRYEKTFIELLHKLDEKFKSNNIPGETDYYGDWDDGPIVFVIEDKK